MQRQESGLFFAFGRMLGFVVLAGLALVILAAMVLLPAYRQWQDVLYERDCQSIAVAENEATLDAQKRLLDALPENEVLTKRLALSQGEMVPDKEVVVTRPGPPATPPDVIAPVRYARPPKPSNLLLTVADRIDRPTTRRGLLLLSAGALLAAMFLFAPPDKKHSA